MKFTRLLLAAFMTVASLIASADVETPFVPSSESFTVDNITYEVLSSTNLTCTVTSCQSTLSAVTIPTTVTYNTSTYSVTSIDDRAFKSCDHLTEITIPSSVTSIDCPFFTACSNLETIKVDEDNPNYCAEDGVLYNKSKTTILACPTTKTGEFTIPNTVTSIGNHAFISCTNLTTVNIQEGVTSILNHAFYGCTGLTSITIPSSMTSIGYYAFYNCTGLTSITCNATTPPTLHSSLGYTTFESVNCNFYVPSSAYYTYKDNSWGSVSSSSFRAMLTTGTVGWATCCVDYDVTVPEQAKAYYVSATDGSTATLTELTTVPANEGFIFNGAKGTFNLEKAETTPTAIENKLTGTTETTTVEAKSVYTLGKVNDNTVGLLTYTGTSIPACKAYLPKDDTSTDEKALMFNFDGSTTGISSAVKDAASDDAPIYNLQGQRVNSMRSGEIYIKNGKKIIFK